MMSACDAPLGPLLPFGFLWCENISRLLADNTDSGLGGAFDNAFTAAFTRPACHDHARVGQRRLYVQQEVVVVGTHLG